MDNMKIVNFLYKKRVAFGFLFGITFLFTALSTHEKSWTSFFVGSFIALLGESIRIVSSGFIVKNDILSTEGPYSIVRHPLYLGSFIMGTGLMLTLIFIGDYDFIWDICFFISYILFFILFYIPVLKREESFLIEKFGQAYLDYKKTVPMLIPNWNSIKNFRKIYSMKNKNFDKKLFMKNREYRALIGVISIITVIFLKYYFI